jgi:hypothetical protein
MMDHVLAVSHRTTQKMQTDIRVRVRFENSIAKFDRSKSLCALDPTVIGVHDHVYYSTILLSEMGFDFSGQ